MADKDGENEIELPIARVNYMLRAAVIPAGAHKLRMEFKPHALQMDKWCVAIMLFSILLSLGGLTYPLWKSVIQKR
jgi:uncharacterized membrane protein YfhO